MESASSISSSDWEEEVGTVAAFIVLEENKKTRNTWVHGINKKREELGEFHRLVQELKNDPERFHMYFRMTKEEFDFLHDLIKNDIQKQNTQLRRAISTEERLSVCLRYVVNQYFTILEKNNLYLKTLLGLS